jgi:hypothetical protein
MSVTQNQAEKILGIYSDPKDPFVLFAQETDPVRKAGCPKSHGCRLC